MDIGFNYNMVQNGNFQKNGPLILPAYGATQWQPIHMISCVAFMQEHKSKNLTNNK